MSRPRPRALGRGLESLIPIAPEGSAEAGIPQYIGVEEVRPSPEQARKRFEADTLLELAESIRQHGVLQPILVRRLSDGYELIAGERRWRAARMAGLKHIPAIVRGPEQEALLLGLVENLQREDLDPIEEARGIKRLIDQFGLTHEEAAARLGKHRVTVTQSLRLLSACPAVISATSAGAISPGHARALAGLPLEEQERGLKVILGRGLSVRATERWVQEHRPRNLPRARGRPTSLPGASELAARLQERFATPVSIRLGPRSAELAFRCRGPQQLAELMERLLR